MAALMSSLRDHLSSQLEVGPSAPREDMKSLNELLIKDGLCVSSRRHVFEPTLLVWNEKLTEPTLDMMTLLMANLVQETDFTRPEDYPWTEETVEELDKCCQAARTLQLAAAKYINGGKSLAGMYGQTIDESTVGAFMTSQRHERAANLVLEAVGHGQDGTEVADAEVPFEEDPEETEPPSPPPVKRQKKIAVKEPRIRKEPKAVVFTRNSWQTKEEEWTCRGHRDFVVIRDMVSGTNENKLIPSAETPRCLALKQFVAPPLHVATPLDRDIHGDADILLKMVHLKGLAGGATRYTTDSFVAATLYAFAADMYLKDITDTPLFIESSWVPSRLTITNSNPMTCLKRVAKPYAHFVPKESAIPTYNYLRLTDNNVDSTLGYYHQNTHSLKSMTGFRIDRNAIPISRPLALFSTMINNAQVPCQINMFIMPTTTMALPPYSGFISVDNTPIKKCSLKDQSKMLSPPNGVPGTFVDASFLDRAHLNKADTRAIDLIPGFGWPMKRKFLDDEERYRTLMESTMSMRLDGTVWQAFLETYCEEHPDSAMRITLYVSMRYVQETIDETGATVWVIAFGEPKDLLQGKKKVRIPCNCTEEEKLARQGKKCGSKSHCTLRSCSADSHWLTTAHNMGYLNLVFVDDASFQSSYLHNQKDLSTKIRLGNETSKSVYGRVNTAKNRGFQSLLGDRPDWSSSEQHIEACQAAVEGFDSYLKSSDSMLYRASDLVQKGVSAVHAVYYNFPGMEFDDNENYSIKNEDIFGPTTAVNLFSYTVSKGTHYMYLSPETAY